MKKISLVCMASCFFLASPLMAKGSVLKKKKYFPKQCIRFHKGKIFVQEDKNWIAISSLHTDAKGFYTYECEVRKKFEKRTPSSIRVNKGKCNRGPAEACNKPKDTNELCDTHDRINPDLGPLPPTPHAR